MNSTMTHTSTAPEQHLQLPSSRRWQAPIIRHPYKTSPKCTHEISEVRYTEYSEIYCARLATADPSVVSHIS